MEDRRTPKQERSLQTRQKILQAARRAVVEKGWARATTRDVAQMAGIGAATIYAYFADMGQILRVLYEEYYAEIAATLSPVLEARPREAIASPETAIAELLDALSAAHRRDPAFSAEMDSMAARDPEIGALEGELDRSIVRGVAAALSEAGATVASGDLAAASWVVYRAAESIIHGAPAPGSAPAREGEPSEAALLREAAAMLGAYLFGTAPPR